MSEDSVDFFNPDDFAIPSEESLDAFDQALIDKILGRVLDLGELVTSEYVTLLVPDEYTRYFDLPQDQKLSLSLSHTITTLLDNSVETYRIERTPSRTAGTPFLLEWQTNVDEIMLFNGPQRAAHTKVEQATLAAELKEVAGAAERRDDMSSKTLHGALALVAQKLEGANVNQNNFAKIITDVTRQDQSHAESRCASVKTKSSGVTTELAYRDFVELTADTTNRRQYMNVTQSGGSEGRLEYSAVKGKSMFMPGVFTRRKILFPTPLELKMRAEEEKATDVVRSTVSEQGVNTPIALTKSMKEIFDAGLREVMNGVDGVYDITVSRLKRLQDIVSVV